MIELRGVSKCYPTRHGDVTVLRDVNLAIRPGQKVGILGRNGAGKSTLVRLMGGAEQPTTGVVKRTMSLSWPLAFTGGFQGSLTGVDNLRFICRIYGVDHRQVLPFVEDFAEIGRYIREPIKTYSAGMRARLAFALSMAIEFDCYLIDEVMAVGDTRFVAKCETELFEKRKDRAFVMVSHVTDSIRKHCSSAFVLSAGMLHPFDDLDAAYEYYTSEAT